MPKIKMALVSPSQRTVLETGMKYGSTPSFRLRCQAILLKSGNEGSDCRPRTSLSVAQELGCCEVSVNDWMQRFSEQGVDGLKVARGRGRKGILQATDLEAVRRAVAGNRQRISLAKAELEQELGREFSPLTLRRFLKKTVDASNAFGG